MEADDQEGAGIQYAILAVEVIMQCPICSRQAENLTPSTLDGLVVGCQHCGDYRISGSAFHELMGLQLEKRAAALAEAKLASQHGWPMISDTFIRMR